LRKVLIIRFRFPTYRNEHRRYDKKDYALTIDTAKEYLMLQKEYEKGKQARRVFLMNVKKKQK
jgi:phage anti-repressor protein